jgi:hypothetical protein
MCRTMWSIPMMELARLPLGAQLISGWASTNSAMLACIGTLNRWRIDGTELIAHQKWSTCRIPARNARSISDQLALEWPPTLSSAK